MIREVCPADYEALARVWAEAMPERAPPTTAGLAHWLEHHPPRARLRAWAAEEDGELVGSAIARLNWSVSPGDSAWVWAGVSEAARGRGVGAALAERALDHARAVGAATLETSALVRSAGERFAERRGFARTRTTSVLRLDVASADPSAFGEREAEARRAGFAVRPLADLGDREHELFEVYARALADVPADEPEDAFTYDDFRELVLGDPELSDEASAVVVRDGRPVALAFVLVDHDAGVGAHEMTATLAEYRGRGLARLAKLATIEWARGHGLSELVTGVDDENAPMLAVNRSVGYRVTHTRATLVRRA